MENCKVRFAKKEDYEQVEKIMKQVQQMHIDWRPDIYRECGTVLAREMFEESVEKETFLVAEADGKVVGVLEFKHRHVETPVHVTRDVLFIDTMAVDEQHRGQGIGHEMFDFIKKLAQERSFDGIELQVNARNKAAYEMYSKCGFTEKSINMELL